jgi:hypothetical protein
MGEERFVNDMVRLIFNAAQNGQITANDTVQSVYNNVVAPWIGGFGFGTMSDTNGEMITNIIIGLIAEYITGLYKTRWFARGGTLPASFNSMPAFALPASAANTGGAVAPVAQVPTVSLPTNSTPAPVSAPPTPGTPAWMLSAGYSIVGTDATYGNVYGIPGRSGQVVLVNGQMVNYPIGAGTVTAPTTAATVTSPSAPTAITPAYLLSLGYQVVGADPTYGSVYQQGSNAPVVLFNGSLQPYTQQIPSAASQAASYVSQPNYSYSGGGVVSPTSTPDSSTPVTAATPVAAAGVSPWLIGGFALMLLLMAKAKPDGSQAK